MLYISLPLQDEIKYPLTLDKRGLGGEGDSLLYTGNLKGNNLELVTVTYERISFTQADTVLAAIDNYKDNQPAQITYRNKTYILSKDCIEETWFNDYVNLNITLQEVL